MASAGALSEKSKEEPTVSVKAGVTTDLMQVFQFIRNLAGPYRTVMVDVCVSQYTRAKREEMRAKNPEWIRDVTTHLYGLSVMLTPTSDVASALNALQSSIDKTIAANGWKAPIYYEVSEGSINPYAPVPKTEGATSIVGDKDGFYQPTQKNE